MNRLPRVRIAAVALGFLAGCSSMEESNNTPPPPPASQANDIRIVQGAASKATAAFEPNPKTVSLGGAATASVRFVNYDAGGGGYDVEATHRIVSDDGTSFDTGNIGTNGAVARSLGKGSYPFHCSLHPAMTGQVEVTD